MDKQEVQRRQWRLMGRTALWGVGALIVIAVFLEANTPEENRLERPATEAEKPARPQRTIYIGSAYATLSGGFLAAPDEEALRWTLKLTEGSARRVDVADERRLDLHGIRQLMGGHKVRVIGGSSDGRAVHLEEPATGETFWAVPEAIAMPTMDADERPIVVGSPYVIVERDAVATANAAEVGPAWEAVVAALPERSIGDDPSTDEVVTGAVREVLATRPDWAALPTGSIVTVVDFDLDEVWAVRVEMEGLERPAWTRARALRRLPPAGE